MNKVALLGRLVKDPEVRYTQGNEPIAIARYALAVNRRFKRQGEPEADFINCVAFGKSAEFTEKYFGKGQQVAIVGRLQVRSWDDKDGNKRWSTDVVVEEQHFAESKQRETKASGNPTGSTTGNSTGSEEGFYPVDDEIDDSDLPF